MKIVVLDKANFLSDFPKMSFDCEWVEYDHTSPEEIYERLRDADIAVTHKTVLNEKHFSKLANLKMVTANSTGYNTIDVFAASKYNIKVCNVQDWCTNAVVEHVISFVFALKRNLLDYHHAIKSGEWKRQAQGSYVIMYPPQREISGSTLGIIGYGTLGKHLEQKAKALGMRVLLSERKFVSDIRNGYASFEEVLTSSDIIVLLSPLNEDTYKMISAIELNQMKSSALLINCGRGGLVDESDLVTALQNGVIAGAGIDVLEKEPPEDGHPLLTYAGKNLLLSSHVAFASQESIENNTGQIVSNIEHFYMGCPKNVVNQYD